MPARSLHATRCYFAKDLILCLAHEEWAQKQDGDVVLNRVKQLIKLNRFDMVKLRTETPEVALLA